MLLGNVAATGVAGTVEPAVAFPHTENIKPG
jgi:hypothetical protein